MIDEEKLHFFVSEVCISDNFSMAESGYKSLNVEEKTSLLNKYYSGLDDRYYSKTSNLIFILSETLKVAWFLYMFLAFLIILKLLLYFLYVQQTVPLIILCLSPSKIRSHFVDKKHGIA